MNLAALGWGLFCRLWPLGKEFLGCLAWLGLAWLGLAILVGTIATSMLPSPGHPGPRKVSLFLIESIAEIIIFYPGLLWAPLLSKPWFILIKSFEKH